MLIILILINFAHAKIYMTFKDEDVELPCSVSESENNDMIINNSSNLIWVGPDSMVTGVNFFNLTRTDQRMTIKENGNLLIKTLKTTDAGKYYCMELNEKGFIHFSFIY